MSRVPHSQDARVQRLIATLIEAGIRDDRVLAVIEHIPRELFVPATFTEHAYDNTALPIGHGQTVSQPQIVAMMTEALRVNRRMKVLEVGTGSGYQTAVLSALSRRVYTIERYKQLLLEAEARLAELGVHNVTTRLGDGHKGWPEQAPFDRIMVTAAADIEVPPALLDQLAIGGILVAPVAASPIDQRLLAVTRMESGVEIRDLGPVRFVPLVADSAEPGKKEPVSRAIARLGRGPKSS